MAGIVAYGAYVPLFRLARGTAGWEGPAERAIANFDEDSATMAVAALRDALTAIDASTAICRFPMKSWTHGALLTKPWYVRGKIASA